MRLQGHLELGSGCGTCGTELVSNCRTLRNIRSSPSTCKGAWKATDGCEDCCCDGLDPGATENPWNDPTNPASDEFLGLYGGLTIGPLTQADPATTVAPPNYITFVGAIISTTQRGAVFGEQWLRKQLTPDCPVCSGLSASYALWCDDAEIGSGTIPTPDNPTPDPLVGWDDPCDPADPELLAAPPPTPILTDNGRRTLMRVQYATGSLSDVEADTPIPSCSGKHITFSFKVLSTHQYGEAIEACEMGGEFDCCRCESHSWGIEESADAVDCLTPPGAQSLQPAEPTTIDEGSPGFDDVDDLRAPWLYSAPLASTRFACLTPVFAHDAADLTVDIYAGSEALANVSVTIWRARTGYPNPAHPVGRIAYPLANAEATALITHIGAGNTMRIDGRTQQQTIDCLGGSISAARIVSKPCGGGFRAPTLDCGSRYWVAIDFDCLNPPADDWRAKVALHPRSRI